MAAPTDTADERPQPSNDPLLSATAIVDFEQTDISQLIAARTWLDLPEFDRVGAIYTYVRDEIEFGYNSDDDIPASQVLADGFGQCNTKASLLMALLRGSGVRCRFHGAAITKQLQKGLVPRFLYPVAPTEIIHSWVEVEQHGRWTRLEGVILDTDYIEGLRQTFPERRAAFLGYGVGTDNMADPRIEWNGHDTEIQMTGLSSDYGVFEHPDEFYDSVGTNLTGLRALVYRVAVRRLMTRNARALRRHCCSE